MYVSLSRIGSSSNANTDHQKFPCVSLAYSDRFFPYYSDYLQYSNHSQYQNKQNPSILKTSIPQTLTEIPSSSQYLSSNEQYSFPQYPSDSSQSSQSSYPSREISSYENTDISSTKEDYKNDKNYKNYNAKQEIQQKKLLPVLSSTFNLREICKQCILLEDHLSHKEKRCFDCCVKHFLALEGLSEEAVTLDKDKQNDDSIYTLPNEIRNIQQYWFENPDKNSYETAQRLRKIRKRYQTDVFPLVFNNTCEGNSCSIAN